MVWVLYREKDKHLLALDASNGLNASNFVLNCVSNCGLNVLSDDWNDGLNVLSGGLEQSDGLEV